ncbi:tocopherol cyclase family protein [Microbacterium sp. 22195]
MIIALNGVNRGPYGPWAALGFAAHPGGFLCVDAHPTASADHVGIGAHAGDAFHGDDRRLRVDLGPDARLDVTIDDPLPWPHRAFGGSSLFQSVPALNQYWHPWLLGGRVNGTATVGDETWELHDAQIYAEKNWGREGFPDSWWWGQAQGFEERDACVAFAGGQVHSGPIRTEVTAWSSGCPEVASSASEIRGSARCMRSSTMNDGCCTAGASGGRSTSPARRRAQHPTSFPCRCPPRSATRRAHSSISPARSR